MNKLTNAKFPGFVQAAQFVNCVKSVKSIKPVNSVFLWEKFPKQETFSLVKSVKCVNSVKSSCLVKLVHWALHLDKSCKWDCHLFACKICKIYKTCQFCLSLRKISEQETFLLVKSVKCVNSVKSSCLVKLVHWALHLDKSCKWDYHLFPCKFYKTCQFCLSRPLWGTIHVRVSQVILNWPVSGILAWKF